MDGAVLTFDQDAIAIGDLYARSRSSLSDSVECLIKAGHKLKAKKDSLLHGEWLPWLKENRDALGFGSRQTAHKLIQAAEKCRASATFGEKEAIGISRKIWGHGRAISAWLICAASFSSNWTLTPNFPARIKRPAAFAAAVGTSSSTASGGSDWSSSSVSYEPFSVSFETCSGSVTSPDGPEIGPSGPQPSARRP